MPASSFHSVFSRFNQAQSNLEKRREKINLGGNENSASFSFGWAGNEMSELRLLQCGQFHSRFEFFKSGRMKLKSKLINLNSINLIRLWFIWSRDWLMPPFRTSFFSNFNPRNRCRGCSSGSWLSFILLSNWTELKWSWIMKKE